MRRKLAFLVFVCVAVLHPVSCPQAQEHNPFKGLQLLSLANLQVKAGQYVSGFEIDTWDVEIISVCIIPPGWDVGGGTDGSPGGTLHGYGQIGVAFLADPNPELLKNLFLVKIDSFRAKAAVDSYGSGTPVTFAGTATIGTYGSDDFPGRKVPLLLSNFVLVPATQCPPYGKVQHAAQ